MHCLGNTIEQATHTHTHTHTHTAATALCLVTDLT